MSPPSALRTVAGFPVLVWRCARPWLAVSSAVHGGGIGERAWVLNATVPTGYDHPDPDVHVAEMAGALELDGPGTGMVTAVDVRHEVTAIDSGVHATVTTGVGLPIWAAEPTTVAHEREFKPGTINAVCWAPVRLGDAALVNAVATVAEAKAQALAEAGVEGTGTPTDATIVLCPPEDRPESYGGPRSTIGSALARAVHASITAGLRVQDSRYRQR